MANIHAINAQGTEYGIAAENGITQEQADAIATIGDAADLETTEKTTLVGAVNEVNGKLSRETVIYENAAPIAEQGELDISVSGLTNAKALKITYGNVYDGACFLKEETYPLMANKESNICLSQAAITADDTIQTIDARNIMLNKSRTMLKISRGSYYEWDVNSNSKEISFSGNSAKVIKVVAIF